jgi:RNA polymerase sigma-70 factor (ECF subfamily)
VIGVGEHREVTMQATDRELWQRCSTGDDQAFGQLYDRHVRVVFTFLHRRTACWSEAEDLTSSVFLQAWRRRADVVLDRDSMLPWLLGVAAYTARSAWRSKFRYRRALSTIQNLAQDEHDLADEVADRLDRDHRIRQVRVLVRQLPRQEQEVLELCVWAGLDQQAAAISLGVPVGTVKSRLSRARQHLRKLLASTPEENQ